MSTSNHSTGKDLNRFHVRDFGAAGDGAANDTTAVQRALDACHANGGGEVYFSPGIYVCGTLDLRSGCEIYLGAGAVLRGSPRREDYTTDGNAPYDVDLPGRPDSPVSAAHLLRAYRAERIAIRGRGTIDGNGQAFFGPPKEDHPLRRFRILGWRPGHMLAFCECRDVLIEGVHLINSATYTVWPFACERVRIQGVTVLNPPETPNGDGLDPTGCRDVIISDCFIDTADDCIALYSGSANGAVGPDAHDCENVIVSRCILRSCCTAIRLGPHGDGAVRDVILSDLTIAARNGISMHVYPLAGGLPAGTLWEHLYGPRIEHIQAHNCSIRASQTPLFWQVLPDSPPPAGIRHVTFGHLQLQSPGAVCLTGCAANPLQDIELHDMTLRMDPPASAWTHPIPDPLGHLSSEVCLRIPYALFLRHVQGGRLRNIRVAETSVGTSRAPLGLEHTRDIDLRSIRA